MNEHLTNETTSLIKKKSESILVKVTDKAGGLLTFQAMVPFGFLGALLIDLGFKRLNENNNNENNNIVIQVIRAGAFVIMFITAEEGKRQVVRLYNTEAFKNLGKAQTWKDFFDCSQWKAIDYVTFPLNTLASIVPSSTFAYISHVGFENMAVLLGGYNNKITDFIAGKMLSPWVQGPFMVASFICNMFGFPNIHTGVLEKYVKNPLYYLIENPKFRRQKETLHLAIEAMRLKCKALYEAGNRKEIKEILDNLKNKSVEELREELLKDIPEEYRQDPESWGEFIHKHLMGLSLSAIVIWGFLSFYEMGKGAAIFFSLPTIFSLPVLSQVWGIMALASVCGLGFDCAYTLGVSLIERCYGRNSDVNIFSTGRSAWVLVATLGIALFGSAPNAYQSIIAGLGKNWVDISIAYAASVFAEMMGIFALMKINNTQKVVSKNGDSKNIWMFDEKLKQSANLDELSEEEVHKLYSIYQTHSNKNIEETQIMVGDDNSASQLPSQYRTGVKCIIDSLKSSIACCFFGNPNVSNNTKDNNPCPQNSEINGIKKRSIV